MRNGTRGYPISWIAQLSTAGATNEKRSVSPYVSSHGAALLQVQSLATGVRENYAMLKEVLHKKFVPKEQVELHKAEFRARHRKRNKKLPDLTSSLRRLVSRAYPKAVPDLKDSLAIDALED